MCFLGWLEQPLILYLLTSVLTQPLWCTTTACSAQLGFSKSILRRKVPCLGKIWCMVNKERQSPVENACSVIKEHISSDKYRGWFALCFISSRSRKGRDTLQVHPDSWQTGIPCEFRVLECSHKRLACMLQDLQEAGDSLGASSQSTDPRFAWLAGTRTWGAQDFFCQ